MDEIHIDEYKKLSEKSYFDDRLVVAKSYTEATILTYQRVPGTNEALGGIVDSDNLFISESGQHIVGTDVVDAYVPEKTEYQDRKVVWFGYFHKHWGHFLTEMVSRCWYFANHSVDDEDFYIAYGLKTDSCNEEMTGTYREFLTLLGIPDDRIILISEPTRFREVIIPDLSCEAGNWFTREYRDIFDKLISNAHEEKNENIYLTRLKGKGLSRTQIGEKAIMKTFRGSNYRIVAPEQLSLKEQISIFASAKHMVIVEGTLMHNILFCKPGTEVTIINRVIGANGYQPLLNEVKNIEVTYVDAHLSFFPVFAGGPFLFYFSEELCNYCEEHSIRYAKYREGGFRLHIKLIWYFLMYLENMSVTAIDNWNLIEKHDNGMMKQYRFYRNKLKEYDSRPNRKARGAFSKISKKLFGL